MGMKEIEKVMEGIRTCEKENDCYNSNIHKCLYFEPREKIKIVLVTESPTEETDANEFKEILDKRLRNAREKYTKKSWEKPQNIFTFLYDTFLPIFKGTCRDFADMFLGKVYWTHVGKKPQKYCKEEFLDCAKKHLWKEIKAIQPELVVIASSVACQFFWGKGFKKKFEEQKNSSLTLPMEGFPYKAVVFPNPSPTNGKWKKYAYEKNKEIIEEIRKEIKDVLLGRESNK